LKSWKSRLNLSHGNKKINKKKVTKIDAGKSPTFRPRSYATSRLRPANQLHFLPYANAIYRMSLELSSVDKVNKNLKDRKTNFRLIMSGHGSTNPANLAKFGPVDVVR